MQQPSKKLSTKRSYDLKDLQALVILASFKLDRPVNYVVKTAVKEWLINNGYLRK